MQTTKKQLLTFHITIQGVACTWMPPTCLFVPWQFSPLRPVVKGSTLGWYINRKFVSYNQLKKQVTANK